METDRKITVVGAISVGVTWVFGNVLFKPESRWANCVFGICHFSEKVWMITPTDFEKPLMINTIEVSDVVGYCNRSGVCLCFDCKMNRFRKHDFFDMFKDCSGFTLGVPQNLGEIPLWFNSPPYSEKWKYFLLKPEGGRIMNRKDIG